MKRSSLRLIAVAIGMLVFASCSQNPEVVYERTCHEQLREKTIVDDDVCVEHDDVRRAVVCRYGEERSRVLLAICETESGCKHNDGYGRVIRGGKGGKMVGAFQINPVNFTRCGGASLVETTEGNVDCAAMILTEFESRGLGIREVLMSYNAGYSVLGEEGTARWRSAYRYAEEVMGRIGGVRE